MLVIGAKRNFYGATVGLLTCAFIASISAEAAAQQVALEEIVVTARKRAESLQEIPVAISAFSASQLENLGFDNLTDVSQFTPGLEYNQQGVQAPGRIYTQIRFRGMGTEINEPFGQVGSAFLDGIYMASGVSSIGVENLERVEVVKGPSSAWLGRSTFAGAINMITKTPSTEEFSGRVTGEYAEYGSYDFSLGLEGPIVKDRLAVRVFAQGYGTDGQYTASDGGQLGQERTDSISGTLYATPNERLEIKLNALHAEDKDGGVPAVLFSGPNGRRGTDLGLTNCFADGVTSPTLFKLNDPALGALTDFVCGEIPSRLDLVDTNTTISPDLLEFWNTVVPSRDDVPSLDRVGNHRKQVRFSASLDYELPFEGVLANSTLSVLAGLGEENVNTIRDADMTGINNWYARAPQHISTQQYEARITSDQENALTWLLGVSLFDATFTSQFGGTAEPVIGIDGGITTGPIFTAFDLDVALGGTSDGFCPCVLPPFLPDPINQGKTFGVFGSLGYQVTEEFAVDFEWRWQRDKIRTESATPLTTLGIAAPFLIGEGDQGTILGEQFTTFLPRVTLQYQPTDATNVWATFSRGNNPGFFNAGLTSLSEADATLLLAENPDTTLFLDEEKLDNYELGWKQSFLENRANISLVGYYMEWKNQKTRTAVIYTDSLGRESNVSAAVGGFSTDLKGFEFEGSAAVTDNLTIDASVSWADAEFKDFECGFTDDYAPANANGILVCDGNRPIQYPEWSGTFSATWVDELSADWNYFSRVDGIYRGKRYVDEQNFAYIGDAWLFNLRLGIESEDLRLEGFVTNLFNNKQYTGGARWSDFSADRNTIIPLEAFVQQAIALSPPDLRTVGVRAAFDF
ncbi:MAG: TonB-dependent receptor [Rhodospirillaceae bacterium]